MKRVLIAIFLAAVLFMVPISSVAQTANIETKSQISNLDGNLPTIFMTSEERVQLNQYIEENFDDDSRPDAINLVNEIVGSYNEEYSGYEIDTLALADAINIFGYKPIPEDELNLVTNEDQLRDLIEEYWYVSNDGVIDNALGGLANKIVELIKGRLGWVYQLFSQGIYLFTEGVRLIIDFIQLPIALAVALVAVVNQLIAVPILISDLLALFFSLEFQQFLETLLTFTQDFSEDFSEMITTIRQLVQDFIALYNYLGDILDFIGWLGEEHWNDPIMVTGIVNKNLGPLAGATVTCRGETSTTNSNGEFSFNVNSDPAEDTIPSNQWYGMHNCQITITEDGELLKETPKLLSYVFAGGQINWNFYIIKGRSRQILQNLPQLFSNLLLKIQAIFSNIFDIWKNPVPLVQY